MNEHEHQPDRDESATESSAPKEIPEEATDPSFVGALRIEVDYDTRVNYAMQQNDVPVVNLLKIRNDSDQDIDDLTVRLEIARGASEVLDLRVASIAAESTFNFESVDLPLRPETLASQTERESTVLSIEVRKDEWVLAQKRSPIEVLAYNEWGGFSTLPEILAAFVLPNHPAIDEILSLTRKHLSESTGDDSLSGYQSLSAKRVRQIVQSCYEAISSLEIGYINPPASFEHDGQKVRSPDQILENRLATCLDLALLVAAVLEQVGLHPLVVVIRGHAFVGAWTHDTTFPEPAIDDLARLRKRVKLDEVCVFETTFVTHKPAVLFAEAEREALRYLETTDEFLYCIDVTTARRRHRIRPLPLRVTGSTPLPDSWQETQAATTTVAPVTTVRKDAQEDPDVDEPRSFGSLKTEGEGPATRLDRWKRKLLDLSLRNRLINHKETKKTIPLLVPDLGELEDALAEEKTFRLEPRPVVAETGSPRSADVHRERTQEDLLEEVLNADLAKRRLHASLGEDQLDKNVLESYRLARTSLEESGANTLFLALGFLVWFESDSSSEPRRAPLLLLPLTIQRKSIQEGFTLRLSDDDPRVNVTLLEMLQNRFRIETEGLDELPLDESGLDVALILRRFRERIRDMRRWDIAEEACIGLYSFTKFLMWRDLAHRAEDLMNSAIVRHLVERPEQAFDDGTTFPVPEELDAKRPAADTLCPVDADSSQLAAVYAAHDGRSFVLQGPPGTGKSQTITNLIAHALGHEKRVLFVAEKMAALNVVHQRLSRIGLTPWCLELHSNKTNKKDVLAQIEQSVHAAKIHPPARWKEIASEIERLRADLNRYVTRIHEPGSFGESVFQVTSRLIGLRDAPRVALEIRHPEPTTANELSCLRELIEKLGTAAADVGDLRSHPLRSVGRKDWVSALPDDVHRAATELEETADRLQKAVEAVSRALRVSRDPSGARETHDQIVLLSAIAVLLLKTPALERSILEESGWDDLRKELETWINRGRARDELQEQLLSRYNPALLDSELREPLDRLRQARQKFFPFSWLGVRAVRKELRSLNGQRKVPDPITLERDLARAVELQNDSAALADSAEGSRFFGRKWRAGEADWDDLEAQVEFAGRARKLLLAISEEDSGWCGGLRERVISLASSERDLAAEGSSLRADLVEIVREIRKLQKHREALDELLALSTSDAWGDRKDPGYLDRVAEFSRSLRSERHSLREWCYWRSVQNEVESAGLRPLSQGLEAGSLALDQLSPAFERSFGESWLGAITDADDLLRRFSSAEHARQIERFRNLDQEVMRVSRDLVRARLSARSNRADLRGDVNERSEVGILQRELKKQRRHMPVRKLIESLPNLLPSLKPCLLMSPLSVAQYLDASYPPFDLVIFDEASQIPVWDAIGALARGTHVVVVGDSKQLPPTSFFEPADDEDEVEDEDIVQDVESILDECEASGLPPMRLLWHYRSRHESLIAFSNYHYYENRLQTFPAPEDHGHDLGVSLRYLENGVYDKGASRTNRVEAEAIVAEIVERLKAPGVPAEKASIGVVAFSQAQQILVEDLLEEARKAHPEIDIYFGSEVPEPLFVKNLENVQGDERDVILFTICYGPDQVGKISMAFGPLNRDGGERRLNVAITRARQQVIVFSSMKAENIELSRTRALGVKHLKTFLDYADRGPRAMAEAITLDPDADFESPFEKDVFDSLVAKGWDVDLQVGCSGYRIDLGVKDPETPGRYLLGIECDGATYHSARTARDRDRLREAVLRGMGWRIHRVWSTDWWHNRARQEEILEEALDEARKAPSGPPVQSVPEPDDEPEVEPDAREFELIAKQAARSEQVPERFAEEEDPRRQPYPVWIEPDLLGTQEGFYEGRAASQIRRRILAVVEEAAPIAMDTACRRVAASWGLLKVTKRLRGRVEQVLKGMLEVERPVLVDGFLWRPDQNRQEFTTYRVPDPSDPSPRKAEEIPDVEIANAARVVLEKQYSLPTRELLKETAQIFGITRLGKAVEQSMEAGVRLLEQRGGCLRSEDAVSLPNDAGTVGH